MLPMFQYLVGTLCPLFRHHCRQACDLDLNEVVASGGNVILTSGRKAAAGEPSIQLLSSRQNVKFGVWRDIRETVTSRVGGLTKLRRRNALENGSKLT